MAEDRSLEDVLTRYFRAHSPSGTTGGLDADGVRHVLHTLGLDPALLDDDERAAIEGAALALGLRLDEDTLSALSQAFGRAIARMVDAETEVVRARLREVAPEERAEALDVFLHAARPMADRLLATTHRLRLHQALRDALAEEALEEPLVPHRSIALVDHVKSTPWLRHASRADTVGFVDRLHGVAQEVCVGRRVTAVKFVGDGVYLSGPSAPDVLAAALDAVRALDTAPLRTRGGVAHGPLVRRAGDYFGYAVNLASRLTEEAEPGTVLAAEDALAGAAGEPRTVALRGLEGTFDVVALRP